NFDSHLGYLPVHGVITTNVAYGAYLSAAEAAFIRGYYAPFFSSSAPSMPAWYAAIRAYLKLSNPSQLVGSSVSRSFCVDYPDCDFYPKDVVDSHVVNPQGHLGFADTYPHFPETNQDDISGWYVNPTDTPNITNMQNALLTEAIARNVDFMFFDNM